MRHILTPSSVLLAVSLILFAASAALADETSPQPAGSVRSAKGEALLLRGGNAPVQLHPGVRIYEKDVITTGKESSVGLVMRDNATVSLGAGSKLIIEQYLFEPNKGRLASLLRLSRGSLGQVSGLIAKVNPRAALVQSPVVTIGIRGTYFAISVPDGLEESFPPIEEAR